MKKLLGSLLLTFLIVMPVNATPPKNLISVNDTEVHYLEAVSWTTLHSYKDDTIYVECSSNETTIVNDNIQNPLWSSYDNWNDGRFKIGESLYPYWIGGGANCTATQMKYTWSESTGYIFTPLASTSFVVLP